MSQNKNESKPPSVVKPRDEGLDETPCSASCPKCKLDYYVDEYGICRRCGTGGIMRQGTTFAEWYESKIGVTLEQAKRAGVYDLALLEEAFKFLPNATESDHGKPMSEIETKLPGGPPRIVMPLCGAPGWVGHEWKMRGFYSDECIHCGTIAVEGHNGMKKNWEHCPLRARKISDFKSQHNV